MGGISGQSGMAAEVSNGAITPDRSKNRDQLEEQFYFAYDPSHIKNLIKTADYTLIGGGAHFEVFLFSRQKIVAKKPTVSAPASADWYFRCLEHLETAGITLFPPVSILRVESHDWLITPYFASHYYVTKAKLEKLTDLDGEVRKTKNFGYTLEDILHCGEYGGSQFVLDWSDLRDYHL